MFRGRLAMRDVSIKGVVLGGITDLLGATISLLVIAGSLAAAGLSTDQVKALVATNAWVVTLALAGRGTAHVLGGYVAARVAQRGSVLNGSLSPLLGIGLTLLSWWSGATAPTGRDVAWLALGPVGGAVGGYLRLHRRRRPERAGAPSARPASAVISIMAVGLGAVVYLVASAVSAVAVLGYLLGSGIPGEHLRAVVATNRWVLAVVVGTQALAGVLGGYIAARIAGCPPALIQASLAVVVGFGLILACWAAWGTLLPPWIVAVSLPLSVACALAGGHLHAAERRQRDVGVAAGR